MDSYESISCLFGKETLLLVIANVIFTLEARHDQNSKCRKQNLEQ